MKEEDIYKFIYSGIGYASLAIDKFKKAIEEIIKSGKISEQEGKKIIEDFIKTANEKKAEYEKQLKDIVDNFMEKADFATKEDIEKISNRITILEKLIEEKKQ